MSLAVKLLEALDIFLEKVTPIQHNRRKRKALASIERELERALASAFKAQGTAFVKRLARHKDKFPATANESLTEAIEEWDELWWYTVFDEATLRTLRLFTTPLSRAARKALLAGVAQTIADAGLAISFDLKNPRAVAYLEAHGAELVKGINETTRAYIKTVITEGVEQGLSYDQMARKIIERYSEFAIPKPQGHIRTRAHLIAVTEAGSAYVEGNMQAAQDLEAAGLTMVKKWSTVGDDRVSDGCRANEEAGWIPLSQAFPSGHQQPLRFPGCRCDLLTKRADEVSEAALVEYNKNHDKRGRFARGSGRGKAKEAEFVRQLQRMRSDNDVLLVGKLQRDIVQGWTHRIAGNQGVIVTGKQRRHYLEKHSEVVPFEGKIKMALLRPTAVHRNMDDANMAIFYKRVGKKSYLRIAVLMQRTPGFHKHSVMSVRLAKSAEVERGEARRVHPKK